jgi:hypothetical protein
MTTRSKESLEGAIAFRWSFIIARVSGWTIDKTQGQRTTDKEGDNKRPEMVAPFTETMTRGMPRQTLPTSQSPASQFPPTLYPDIGPSSLAQMKKSLGVSYCLSDFITSVHHQPQCQNQNIQSGHRLTSLFLTSLFVFTFGYPSSRYGVHSTRSPSSMCTSRSTR